RPHSEYAVLSTVIGYFESHATYARGEDSKSKSKQFFCAGFLDVFQGAESKTPGMDVPADFLDSVANALYDEARCGITHEAMTRRRIMLSNRYNEAIGVSVEKKTGQIDAVIMSPRLIVEDISAHLDRYVTTLRDPANVKARELFERACKLKTPEGPPLNVPPEALAGME